MKSFLFIALSCFFIQLAISTNCEFKSNPLKQFKVIYTRSSGESVKQDFKYSKMVMEYCPDEDMKGGNFKFTWTYSTSDESIKGRAIMDKLKDDFPEIASDSQFSIGYHGTDLIELKVYRDGEFGAAYVLQVKQKEILMDFNFLIEKESPNEKEFHELIVNILPQTIEFLQ